MTDRTAESGYELVLDNRKLILVFAVLIVICGCFFVVGFIEGKRQGYQEGTQIAAESSAKANPYGSQAKPAVVDTGTTSSKDSSGDQQLDWYKNVSRRENEPTGIVPPTTTSAPAKKMVEPAPQKQTAGKPRQQANTARAEPVTYSVQIGAFRQRKEPEMRAQMLRSKGYDCRIESTDIPEPLYLLKVGKFSSRADAVAMQLRLKKAGFTSAFIKIN
jgi:cell division protein FtsN